MKKLFDALLGVIIAWLIVCLMVKVITMCFGLPFTWSIGTGVFATITLIRYAFNIEG